MSSRTHATRLVALFACAVALTLGIAASAAASSPPNGELVVRFKNATTSAEMAAVAKRAGLTGLEPAVGGAKLLRPRAGVTPEAALAAIRAERSVAWAAPNHRARIAAFVPNDNGMATRGEPYGWWQNVQWNLNGEFGINVGGAWDAARAVGREGGRGVVVAVLDTGVAYADRGPYRRSPELPAGRIKRGYDFVGEDPYPNDANGHGTFVASTIAGATNNAYGMAGIAYKATIMPVRVLDASGEGSSVRIARGIRWAVDNGAHVINISIELYDPIAQRALSITAAPEIRSALTYANQRRVVVVAAAGNSSQSDVPSRRLGPMVIYVGGTTEYGCLGEYSNSGPGMDLVAPGGGTDAAFDDDPNCLADRPGRSIPQITFRRRQPSSFFVPSSYEGTSMAAPHVSGVVALLLGTRALGRNPTPGTIQRHLTSTTRDLGAPGRDRRYGAGLLDASAALAIATKSG